MTYIRRNLMQQVGRYFAVRNKVNSHIKRAHAFISGKSGCSKKIEANAMKEMNTFKGCIFIMLYKIQASTLTEKLYNLKQIGQIKIFYR